MTRDLYIHACVAGYSCGGKPSNLSSGLNLTISRVFRHFTVSKNSMKSLPKVQLELPAECLVYYENRIAVVQNVWFEKNLKMKFTQFSSQ